MSNPAYNATIKADGRAVQVYRTKRNTWCELPLCKVEHEQNAVTIGKEIEEKKKTT